MSDKSDSDQPTNPNPDDSITVFGGEIDNDWGEAFAADDFMLNPEEDESGEFFLEEDEFESTPSSEDSDDSDVDSPDKVPGTAAHLSFISQLLLSCSKTFAACKNRILSLPLHFRIPALVVPLLIISISIYLLTSSTDAPTTEPDVASETTPPSDENVEQIITEKPGEIVTLEINTPDEKVKKKWPLPPFLISTNDNMKGDDVFFVEVEITLILLMGEEESLPTDKSVIIRDIIYQFFNNRPLYELRRFSLARSEMNRKLFSWLEKQWHHDQISTIVFNRYRVL